MILTLLIMVAVVAVMAYAIYPGRSTDMIGEHAYNNRYSDAPGSRDDHLG